MHFSPNRCEKVSGSGDQSEVGRQQRVPLSIVAKLFPRPQRKASSPGSSSTVLAQRTRLLLAARRRQNSQPRTVAYNWPQPIVAPPVAPSNKPLAPFFWKAYLSYKLNNT